jgi:hypothetical protein
VSEEPGFVPCNVRYARSDHVFGSSRSRMMGSRSSGKPFQEDRIARLKLKEAILRSKADSDQCAVLFKRLSNAMQRFVDSFGALESRPCQLGSWSSLFHCRLRANGGVLGGTLSFLDLSEVHRKRVSAKMLNYRVPSSSVWRQTENEGRAGPGGQAPPARLLCMVSSKRRCTRMPRMHGKCLPCTQCCSQARSLKVQMGEIRGGKNRHLKAAIMTLLTLTMTSSLIVASSHALAALFCAWHPIPYYFPDSQ